MSDTNRCAATCEGHGRCVLRGLHGEVHHGADGHTWEGWGEPPGPDEPDPSNEPLQCLSACDGHGPCTLHNGHGGAHSAVDGHTWEGWGEVFEAKRLEFAPPGRVVARMLRIRARFGDCEFEAFGSMEVVRELFAVFVAHPRVHPTLGRRRK